MFARVSLLLGMQGSTHGAPSYEFEFDAALKFSSGEIIQHEVQCSLCNSNLNALSVDKMCEDNA